MSRRCHLEVFPADAWQTGKGKQSFPGGGRRARREALAYARRESRPGRVMHVLKLCESDQTLATCTEAGGEVRCFNHHTEKWE